MGRGGRGRRDTDREDYMVEQALEQETATMKLEYDERGDSAFVVVGQPIVPGGDHHKGRVDQDRFVRYDADDEIMEYEFLNVRRYGVRLDDLEHRDELARLF